MEGPEGVVYELKNYLITFDLQLHTYSYTIDMNSLCNYMLLILDNIGLPNKWLLSNTIYISSVASDVNLIIKRSRRLSLIMFCFQRGRSPSWKHVVT